MGWRYVIPRRGYFRSLRIARACPEIRHHIDRAALYGAADLVILLPFILIVAVWTPVEWLLSKVRLPRLPDFAQWRNDEIEAAHKIVPVDEIRRRIGLPVATISRKPAP